MSLLIAGSIATDHLMNFGGKFADSLVVDQLDKLSVSFLVDDLEIRRGGCAGNICFGLGRLGLRPVLVGAAGEDFADYRSWLERHGVDCDSVRISEDLHTARFVCTTDATMAQFASFYPGAMSEARLIELGPIARRVGEPTFVLVGPDDPQGMVRHTQECRQRGYAFIADPSQQLAFGEGDMIRELVDGAAYLFSNEYESHLIESKTGWSAEEILDRVGTQVITLGPDGVRIVGRDQEKIEVPAVPGVAARRADRRGRRVPLRVPGRAGVAAAPTNGRHRSAACWRPTSSSRSARRSTPSRPSSSWPGSPRPTARKRLPRCGPTSSPELAPAAYDVGRHSVGGALLADVLLLAHPAPRLYVDPGGRVVGRHGHGPAHRDSGHRLRELDDRPRAGHPATVQLTVTAPPRPPRAGARPRPGARRRAGAARPGRCRARARRRTLPWVSAPMAASTWLGSRVLAVHAEPLATAKPRRSSSVTNASPST